MSDENWRTETRAEDYFLHRQKKLDLADRRPVIRTASDLVGPGIGAFATRLDDFNNLLATFNGFYSAAADATNAPDAALPTTAEPFVGFVVSDAELGGLQVFTGLDTGTEYRRTFLRSPIDPESINWGLWA